VCQTINGVITKEHVMSGRTPLRWAFPVATAALLFVISSAAAFAQDNAGQVRIVGTAPQTVQLTQNVDYTDLNLATPAGASALKQRIRDTASSICEQLADSHPTNPSAADDEDQRNCVNTAVDDAMGQAKRVIASAESR
jgi:UrcA family protein